MAITNLDSDKTIKVPYGFNGEKITIAEMVKTKEFTSLEPLFAEHILDMIRDNPSIGILKGGGGRSEEQVRNLFYANYKKIADAPDYENDASKYEEIKSGKIKWNPEDSQWYQRVTNKTVAVPGGSWHEGGYAVDFTGNVDLAGKVGKKYQLEQITGTGETHHFQPLGVPISKRMFLELKNTYGIDAIKTPLSPDILLYINKEIASNVPRHPQRIKKVLDAALAKFKTSLPGADEKTVREQFLTFAGQSASPVKVDWSQVSNPTPTTVAKAVVPRTTTTTTSTTSTLPPTTTTTSPKTGTPLEIMQNNAAEYANNPTATVPPSTTTLAPQTTTTVPPSTTTTVPEQVGGQRSLAPSQSEYGARPSQPTPTTTTIPVTNTTMKPTSTTMSPSTTTTQPPTTQSTIPGSGATAADVFTGNTTASYAGGIDPNYKGITKQTGYGTDGYTYTTNDWQSIFELTSNEVITVQQQLMKAFPGFVPGVLGDKTDSKTIKAYKQALSRINLLNQDTASPLRGKTVLNQIELLTKNPAAQTSTALPSYQLNNPIDLKAVFKKAAQDSLGHNLGEGDLNNLVETYQAQQLAYQRKVSTGGVVTAPPSPQTFATQSIQKDFGDEVDIKKMDNIFSSIDKALSGGQ